MTQKTKKETDHAPKSTNPSINVAPSPHIVESAFTTRRMMFDVLIALIPVICVSIYVFKIYAVKQLIICLSSCLISEVIFVKMRGKAFTLKDGSAAVTGVILALSLPGTAPWYVGVIASVVAISIGKIIFGGLGMNLFNPAMVGRAFVMISFASVMGAAAYENAGGVVNAITQATPLNAFKQSNIMTPLSSLFWGTTNGSLGETSAIACITGGLYLCIRKTASWEIPFGIISVILFISAIKDIVGPFSGYLVLHHLMGGAALFGAFFIATDPVTSPLTRKGKLIYGVGIGALIMLLRLFSGYPEGVMFAILLMNGLTPLINRWTIPIPLGDE
ncbi:MAG: RnfABCDGE type electron transport complex subunit D [Desulfobacterales bacterium]